MEIETLRTSQLSLRANNFLLFTSYNPAALLSFVMYSSDKLVWVGGGVSVGILGVVWWQWDLPAAADLATLVSLGVSVWVLLNLRRIEQAYLFQASAPELLDKLEDRRSDLNKQLNDYESSREKIGEILSSCEGILTTVERRVQGVSSEVRNSVQTLAEDIQSCPYPPGSDDEEEVRSIYYGLVTVTDELEGVISDQKLRQ